MFGKLQLLTHVLLLAVVIHSLGVVYGLDSEIGDELATTVPRERYDYLDPPFDLVRDHLGRCLCFSKLECQQLLHMQLWLLAEHDWTRSTCRRHSSVALTWHGIDRCVVLQIVLIMINSVQVF